MPPESSDNPDFLDCAICLQIMRIKFVTSLPCAHSFHTSCIKKLFKHESEDEAKCPLCRQLITGAVAKKYSSTQREKDSQVCESLSRSLELDIEVHNLLFRQSTRLNKRKKK
jgi:hypothetical protein